MTNEVKPSSTMSTSHVIHDPRIWEITCNNRKACVMNLNVHAKIEHDFMYQLDLMTIDILLSLVFRVSYNTKYRNSEKQHWNG